MKPICAGMIQNFRIDRFMESLAVSSPGRMALHALCLFRHPGHSRWHWQGIVREVAHLCHRHFGSRSAAYRVRLVALLAIVAGGSASAFADGPLSELYLTSKTESGGGKAQIDVVQGINVVRGWTTKHGNELGLAVNDTVRTLGVLSVPLPGDVGAEYSLAGTYAGTDYPFPVSSINSLQILDGASDGLHNFAWDFNNNDAWQFNGAWANGTNLFHLPGTVSRAGITCDPSDGTLWLSAYNAGLIEHRSLDGALLSSFPVPHAGNVALALDPADGTLWFLSTAVAGVLVQYSRTGQSLGSQYYPTLAVKNILGGEFRLPPRPAQLHAAGMDSSGALQLILNGVTPGRTNVVQSSFNLSNWTSISTNVAASNTLQMSDPTATNFNVRFYRTFEVH